MKIINSGELARLTGAAHSSNLISVFKGLEARGKEAGLHRPHRLVPYLAQLSHESMGFKYDQEIWGPTAAQSRYDIRTDLGNTPERDGDGYKNRGRGPIQVTGAYNIGRFYSWCLSIFGSSVPDFRENPDLINTDPWEGLSALWYWETNNLNSYCDANNFKGLTRKINGGYNGLSDRQSRYDKIALKFLGYASTSEFQAATPGLAIDGDLGPNTRAALFKALFYADTVVFKKPSFSLLTWLKSLFTFFQKGA